MKLQRQNTQIDGAGKRLFSEIAELIENARQRVYTSINAETTLLNWAEIKVAQYLTQLHSKKWFADKLHRSYQIAGQNNPELQIKSLPAVRSRKKPK